MAKQTVNIGSAANDGTGDPLRTAFDKINDNFTELYSDDAGDVNSVNGASGTVVLDTDDIAEGSTNLYNATHTGDVTGSTALTIAADAVDGTKIADDAVDTEHIADDAVDHDQLADRYTASSAVTSATAITIDTSSADVFTWTAGHSTNVSFTNVKIGSTCTLIVTGGGTSYTLGVQNINGSTGTFNKISGTYDDTSGTKNIIEFKFISTSEAWYQISQIAS